MSSIDSAAPKIRQAAASIARPQSAGAPSKSRHPRLQKAIESRNSITAAISAVGIGVHLFLRFVLHSTPIAYQLPLIIVLLVGGGPQVIELLVKAARREFGSDLLAGISIVTSALLGEYLAGAIVVLMLSGGATLESYAVRSASSVLRALAARLPALAHRKRGAAVSDVPLDSVKAGDTLLVFPHEICPVDGTVLEGHGVMDESYLTGEPFKLSKAPGAGVLSGAINGDAALTIRADRLAVDSRYAKIMQVMRSSAQSTPRLRRLGDQLGAYYTPVAVLIALATWFITGSSNRFLAVLVVATPCPLLIAIPVAIIGAISLSARRGIIIKKPVVLEQVDACRTIIFDKTGTLTYGEPSLSAIELGPGAIESDVLGLAAGLERYSKHPLAVAILKAAEREAIPLLDAAHVSEPPGQGMTGVVSGHRVQITSRKKLASQDPVAAAYLPPESGGLECVVLVDGAYAATFQFRDAPRADGLPFVKHLGPRHRIRRLMLVSGDRESEVRYLADRVGIREIHASKSPEEKLAIVRHETAKANTLYLGDGINDAPALLASTVGVALGQNSDITTEAAGAVIMDSSLKKVDEFLHIGARMRRIALQSAVGGMALSVVGMVLAACGYLPPVAGAAGQELIDLLAVANALRAALAPAVLSDFE